MNTQDDPLLRGKAAWGYCGMGHALFYELIRAGKIPAGIRIGAGRAIGWRRSTLNAYLDRLAQEQGADQRKAND